MVAGDAPQALFVHLDGGAGDREALLGRSDLMASMLAAELLPSSIHVSFSGGSSAFHTGAWEPWIVDELPRWVGDHFGLRATADNTLLTGISGGGHGALKLAFKHPQRFKAVAAMEPVLMPSLHWPPQHTRASWWMLEPSARAVWGEPFPETYLADHPPNIAVANADRIRASGLDIYLEVGDEDLLNLHDGAEFLHRILWRHDIAHEFHLVRWADHGGHSVGDRFIEAMAFLAAAHAGGKKQSRHLELGAAEQRFVTHVLEGGPMRGEPVPDGASQGTTETELSVMRQLWEPLRAPADAQDPNMARHYGKLPDV